MNPLRSAATGGAALAAESSTGATETPDMLQARLARQVLVNHKARIDEIGAWSTMNANLQTQQLAAKAAGLDPDKSVIPWGSTNHVTTIHQDSAAGGLLPKLIFTGTAGLGIGAGLLGLASLAGLVAPTPAALPSQPSTTPPEYEWILDVERTDEYHHQFQHFDEQTHRRDAPPTASRPRANP